jgi:hypothetical protein
MFSTAALRYSHAAASISERAPVVRGRLGERHALMAQRRSEVIVELFENGLGVTNTSFGR